MIFEIGLQIEKLKNIWRQVCSDAQAVDPLAAWYELITFISVEERKRLKDKAQLAQAFYSMEKMLRMFYEEISDEKLHDPDELSGKWKERVLGKDVLENDLRHLEFLANSYGLNPRPRLILIVEGTGEYEQFPRLSSDLFGLSFPQLRIQIENLLGIGNFTGKKKFDRFGALERLIDKWHALDTLVLLILDREGDAPKIKEKLIKKASSYYPQRTVTKAEYIHLWDKSIEFDNFSHDEIAWAMTEVSLQEGQKYGFEKYEFNPKEIAECEANYDAKKGNPLGTLFSEKCGGHSLPKTKLLKILVDGIIDFPDKEFDKNGEPKRPISQVLLKVLRLASGNHQPTRFQVWEENQESGYFGDLLENT